VHKSLEVKQYIVKAKLRAAEGGLVGKVQGAVTCFCL